jgi:hypothetical protein
MKQPDSRTPAKASPGNGRSRPARGDVDARMLDRIRAAAAIVRIRQEALYDRLAGRFRAHLGDAPAHDREARELAADRARADLVAAGAASPQLGERLANFLLRDLDPAATHRHTGEITGPGTLACTRCGASLPFARTATVPPCPRCATTEFTKRP